MISSVKRNHGRATLTLSSGETLSMPRAMLRERPYRSGMPFDRMQFDTFLRDRSYPFGLEKAVALLAGRARTEKEIVDALRKNAYPEMTIARVMAKLSEIGYINDAQFAEQWTAARTARGMGLRRIKMELRQKGVSAEAIDQVVTSVDQTEFTEGAYRAAQKAIRGKALSSPTDRQKVIAALVRRGYSFSEAKQALTRVLENENDE